MPCHYTAGMALVPASLVAAAAAGDTGVLILAVLADRPRLMASFGPPTSWWSCDCNAAEAPSAPSAP
jgi:hypothetical protein